MKILNTAARLKDNTTVQIYQTKGMFDCRAVPLMLRTYAELIENGLTINTTLGFNNDNSVIWAEYDSVPVGGVCYTNRTDIPETWVNFSFTDPGWRKLGINAICYYELEIIAKAQGMTTIASHVSVKNTTRIESHKRTGLIPTFYRMSKTIL